MLTLQLILKRCIDIAIGLVFGCLSVPVLFCAALVVQWYYPGLPMFLRQTRVGRNNVPFVMLKLRTLRIDYDPALHHEEEVPLAIVFLRRIGADELPQLFHLLSGLMSFVGIRPILVPEHEVRYGPDAQRVTSMRPGIISLHGVKTHLESTSDLPITPQHYAFEPTAVDLALGYVVDWSLHKDWLAISAYLQLARKYLTDGTLQFKNLRRS